MADINKTIAIIFEGQDNASPAATRLATSLDAVGKEAREAEEAAAQDAGWAKLQERFGTTSAETEKLTAETDKLTTSQQKSEISADKVATALKALAASLIVKDFIEANLAFEKFEMSMTATTGSAEKARAEFEYVTDVSNRMGVEARSTAEAYAKFSASVKGSSLEGEDARTIFEAFTGTMSRAGASTAEISGAFVQLAQGVSKGKFELEDLKSIADRLPGFFPAFAESLGKTTDELFKMISAGQITGDEMLTFAKTLNIALDGATFDGYGQSFARLRNSIDQVYLIVGDAGAFDVLTKGLQLGTAAVVGTIAIFTLLGEIIGAVAAKLANPLTFDLGDAIDESMTKAAKTTQAASDALFNVEKAAKAVETSGLSAAEVLSRGWEESTEKTKELTKASGDLDKLLKTLGIDPKIFTDPIEEVSKAFTELAANPALDGDKLLAGLVGALRSLPQDANLEAFRNAVVEAFQAGKLNADEFAQALALLDVKQQGLSPSFAPVTEAAKKQADELRQTTEATKKAEEAARDFQLEMEKISSNERIKFMEFSVELNIANLQEQTKRIEASFDSIDNVISESSENLRTLYGLFGDFDSFSWSAQDLFEDQLDIQNQIQKEQLELQKALIASQIANLQAQTNALIKGDALIKVDGAGLQPHLEAFMWEILKTIQVRVNQQGLSLLLGIP